MSEDRFFQNIRSVLVEYKPEVPQSVYTGVRKKLWWSNFTRISATRFNIWYAVLIVTASSLLINFSTKDAAPVLDGPASAQSETPGVSNQEMPVSHAPEVDSGAQSKEMTSKEISPKTPRQASSSEATLEKEPTDVVRDMTSAETRSDETNSAASSLDGKKDSVPPSGKGVKKGLKVKTFQVSDK
jgi:hypothetical protein